MCMVVSINKKSSSKLDVPGVETVLKNSIISIEKYMPLFELDFQFINEL